MKAKEDFKRAASRKSAYTAPKKSAPPRGQGQSQTFAPAPPAPTGPAPPMPKSAQGMQTMKVPPGWKAPVEVKRDEGSDKSKEPVEKDQN